MLANGRKDFIKYPMFKSFCRWQFAVNDQPVNIAFRDKGDFNDLLSRGSRVRKPAFFRTERFSRKIVLLQQSAAQAVADSASLTGNTAAGNADDDVILALQAQQDQRRADDQLQGLQTEDSCRYHDR